MRCRTNRNQVPLKVERVARKKRADAGKTLVQIDARYVTHIQMHQSRDNRRTSHAFPRNCARHHVARGELKRRVITLHESLTTIVAQISAFAAQRLRQQKTRCTRQRKCRWVKLAKLHVCQFRACFCRQGDAVSRSHGGVCCV